MRGFFLSGIAFMRGKSMIERVAIDRLSMRRKVIAQGRRMIFIAAIGHPILLRRRIFDFIVMIRPPGAVTTSVCLSISRHRPSLSKDHVKIRFEP